MLAASKPSKLSPLLTLCQILLWSAVGWQGAAALRALRPCFFRALTSAGYRRLAFSSLFLSTSEGGPKALSSTFQSYPLRLRLRAPITEEPIGRRTGARSSREGQERRGARRGIIPLPASERSPFRAQRCSWGGQLRNPRFSAANRQRTAPQPLRSARTDGGRAASGPR